LAPDHVLELLKLWPGVLAFVGSFVAASVSIYVIQLQNKSTREIEAFKNELVERLEVVKLRVALSTRNFDQENQFLIQAGQAAVDYQTRLQGLTGGTFDAAAVDEIERKTLSFAAALDSGSDVQLAYYRFLQVGMNMSDLARKKKTKTKLKQIWIDQGPTLATNLQNLTLKINDTREQAEAEALRKATQPGGQSQAR
jgi:hypothetical protein